MSRHDDMIRIAAKVAGKSSYRWKLGAVLFRGGRVISSSPNILRNSPQIDYLNATFHAEMATLRGVATTGLKSILYVARVNREGQTAMALPCHNCMRHLKGTNIRAAVFTTGPGEWDMRML